jgi:hypothetical protein
VFVELGIATSLNHQENIDVVQNLVLATNKNFNLNVNNNKE